MARLSPALKIVSVTLTILLWALMTWLMIGLAEWDGKYEFDSAWSVTLALSATLGCVALVASAIRSTLLTRRLAMVCAMVWLGLLVVLYL